MGNKHSHLGEHSSNSSIQRPSRSSHLPQIDELAKILAKRALKEHNIHGIPADIFAKYVFPSYQDLGKRLFAYIGEEIQCSAQCLSIKEFCNAVEHMFATQINDELQLDMFLKMYGENGQITPNGFRELILAAFTIAVDHYSGGPASCPYYSRTIQAVVNGAFHQKQRLSLSYLNQWVLNNCPRLTAGMHRYVIHILSTSYRQQEDTTSGLEASTPVLDEEPSFTEKDVLLPLSEVWLLAVSLPELFTRPSNQDRPSTANGLSPTQCIIARMMGTAHPSHWTPLYKSNEDGIGSNRFNHHVLHYRGPTVMIIKCENDMQFCIASSCEWRESHQYWGTENCMVMQILPEFHCIASGKVKLLYFNESIRGYPFGLRAGADPQHPILSVNPDFTFVSYEGAPYGLLEMQVWGCGPEQAREAQLDLKRWQQKDAEKARVVKINPEDWLDHPDRYLLELGGHPSFSQESRQHSTGSEKSRSKSPVRARRPS